MAIVEDDVRNDSEEENEIEVAVEDEDGEQDSGDDDSDDDDKEEALETKVAELERRIAEDPYNYDDHIELIQALWGLSELECWRSAFEQLQQISLIQAEHWLMRLQTEVSLAHTEEVRDQVTELFQQASLDCYSIPILTCWLGWALEAGAADAVRAALRRVLRLGGAHPAHGKVYWDAYAELEKGQLENLSEDDPSYKEQVDRLLFCYEEIVSRPLVGAADAWPSLEQLVKKHHDDKYLERIKKQHEAAKEYLQKITPFEDKILESEDVEEKMAVYMEYIEVVKELGKDDKYSECDSDGILRVLYDRATTDCLSSRLSSQVLHAWSARASRRTTPGARRELCACARREPRAHAHVVRLMRHDEREGKGFEHIKSLLETSLSKGMETYKDTEALWLAYLEYMRRHTAFDCEQQLARLRRTLRLAWDSLAETWGAEANDCEVPLFWARLEYKRAREPLRGKEIFEEIFNYGENKTMSKYWEALISLETQRTPPPSENKLRDLHKRALRFVQDYPPSVVRLYTDFERDVGSVDTMSACAEDCEAKLKEWRESYQAMKEKMAGQRNKGKQPQNKKQKLDKKQKTDARSPNKGKRKAEDAGEDSGSKKKKENETKGATEGDGSSSSGALKRTHEDGGGDAPATAGKRARRDSGADSTPASREACTLFVSNLEFKVNEEDLRSKLSEFGDIVSLRLREGVKAFGGSICYCQYKKPESVDEAIKHDRCPLNGRPMFLSRYKESTNKEKTFKYATSTEKNKLFVKNLPFSYCTKEKLTEVFEPHGKLIDVRPITHKDGRPKGLAYIEFEDEASASHALEKTNGTLLEERKIDVAISAPPAKTDARGNLGMPKRDAGGSHMRRTQLSGFIPSVLLKASTSKANGSHSNGDEKKTLSNSDFRSLLLKK
ncbi:squamous cell carcinoma antigen recognized by T-cells 3 isoform X4 [Plutella xylostella]|uniref:squamous cell carcinoma antigen recognized by T-cells 3 isoform X3 n=1 Tax=Plutella xylostella TaxID=51655 RepID=UPI002032ABD7|nr:squamous cell carcinoma antigen recognized by T-cells 3 isoform X3 [Plutella xylostella]XP_048482225.1 squamous cell carcinoma antigen recognized by T-cells 3 isoform X4 [Plutella xylostella]